ncbi:MAG: PD40 domain-containing protein [Deltaproteobacteria bacterium]|nr:PD40 domain-containing protein [Deltaproteobacteria bacterium]
MIRNLLLKMFQGSLLLCLMSQASANIQPIVINIDNPKFRKLVTAIPEMTVSPDQKDMTGHGARLSKRLSQLLEFSGYFRILREAGLRGMTETRTTRADPDKIAGFEKEDLRQWQAIGVESLTIGRLIRLPQGTYRLELRSADISAGQRLLGKAYILKSLDEADMALKQYADQLLTAYTGKPGIFNSKIIFTGKKTLHSMKQIYMCDVDGGGLIQLTSAKAIHLSPSFSPDGSKILYTSYESGNPDLYMMNLSNRSVQKISGEQGLNSGGVFSDNGKLIAFSGSIAGNTEIYMKDFISPQRRPLLQGHGIDVDPAFSPDGRWLAFVSGRYGQPHIFRAALQWNQDRSQVRVTGDTRLTYAGWYNATPAWSPDSARLAFAGFDRDIGRFDLFLMNADGTNMERLTLNAGDNENPSWSPNGQMIIFSSNRIAPAGARKGPPQLFIMNRDGSSQRVLATGLYSAETPRWGPFTLTH